MSAQALRQRFNMQLRGLPRQGALGSISVVALYVGQILLSILTGAWLMSLPASIGTVAAVALSLLFTATRLRGLNNIVHECTHNAFCHVRRLNDILGKVCASLILGCFRDYRDEHLTHHAHLGDYEKDQDLQKIQEFRLEDPLTGRTIFRHFVIGMLGLHLSHYISINMSWKDGWPFFIIKCLVVTALIIGFFMWPLETALLAFLPFFWILPCINYWTDCADHGGLIEENDDLYASRNVPVPPPVRLFFFPRNDCYHLVHHLFPHIPSAHLHHCHETLMADNRYKERVSDQSSKWLTKVANMTPRLLRGE